MPYKVSQLLNDIGAPVTATADEPVHDALDRMLRHGFSQLPVVKGYGQQSQFYFVTHESILVALHNFGSRIESPGLRVDDALVRVPNVYRAEDDLFELLIGMHESNAALIVNDERGLTHVVTSWDTSRYFRQWAEDIMQVRDVEHSLRRIVNAAFRKSDGEVDEEKRQSAVQEMTSSNRALRKKFGLAVKQYLTEMVTEPAPLEPEPLALAFAELTKTAKGALTANTFHAEAETSPLEGENAFPRAVGDSPTAHLVDASRALRERFQAGLELYLSKASRHAAVNESLADSAFKFLYDRTAQTKEFGELTLAEYIQMFFSDICWGRCKDAIRLEEDAVRHMFDGVRDTRNSLAHFREEEITAQRRLQLKRCADWLSERERLIVEAFQGPAPGSP